MARILVEGASRGIGLAAVHCALDAGYQVRAFSRSAEAISLTHPDLEKQAGDALNRDDVARAVENVDAVIQTLGMSPGIKMVAGPVTMFSEATRILVEAMENAGVNRLITVTGMGAGDSRGSYVFIQGAIFRTFLGRVYDDKDIQEKIIRESSLDWTIARPVILTNGPAGGRYKALTDRKSWRSGLISRKDVADFLIKQIESSAYLRMTPVLTN